MSFFKTTESATTLKQISPKSLEVKDQHPNMGSSKGFPCSSESRRPRLFLSFSLSHAHESGDLSPESQQPDPSPLPEIPKIQVEQSGEQEVLQSSLFVSESRSGQQGRCLCSSSPSNIKTF